MSLTPTPEEIAAFEHEQLESANRMLAIQADELAQLRILRAVEWQPIETAPKTGEDLHAIEILGWIPDDTDPWDGGDFEVIYWEPFEKKWFCSGDELLGWPSHWQPLPEPPAALGPQPEGEAGGN